ncbi:hypothetical protein BC835DRAFT_1279712 [Cytidiella melzeri]|nr:hypothetical protein BC835DRAFT_1279712 [Cytidiella melzeri]
MWPHLKTPPKPPSLPENCTYTSCFCEENVFLLAQTFVDLPKTGEPRWEVYVVALWNQKSSKQPSSGLVVWDYHVFLVLVLRTAKSISENVPLRGPEDDVLTWVYDLDSRANVPCSFEGE